MPIIRFFVLAFVFFASGLLAPVSYGQNVITHRFSQEELSDPWSLNTWSIDSSSLILFRSDPGSRDLVQGIGNPDNSVNADDLSYGTAYGFQLSVWRRSCTVLN